MHVLFSPQVMVTKQREDLRQQLPALKDLDDMLLVRMIWQLLLFMQLRL